MPGSRGAIHSASVIVNGMVHSKRPQPSLAFGRTAEIYAWQEGQVLNLFAASFPSHLARCPYPSLLLLRPGGEDLYRHWLPIVAAARLSEGIPKLEKWLIAQAEYGTRSWPAA